MKEQGKRKGVPGGVGAGAEEGAEMSLSWLWGWGDSFAIATTFLSPGVKTSSPGLPFPCLKNIRWTRGL